MNPVFRPMQTEDLEQVLAIEKAAFSDAWPVECFAQEFDHSAYVAVVGEEICGYICAWQVLDECSITNIAVKPAYRGQGLGKYMFGELDKLMQDLGVSYYYLEVRASNQPAIALYDKLGFAPVGVRKAYYSNPVEDAVVMAWQKNADTSKI